MVVIVVCLEVWKWTDTIVNGLVSNSRTLLLLNWEHWERTIMDWFWSLDFAGSLIVPAKVRNLLALHIIVRVMSYETGTLLSGGLSLLRVHRRTKIYANTRPGKLLNEKDAVFCAGKLIIHSGLLRVRSRCVATILCVPGYVLYQRRVHCLSFIRLRQKSDMHNTPALHASAKWVLGVQYQVATMAVHHPSPEWINQSGSHRTTQPSNITKSSDHHGSSSNRQ